MSDALNAAIDDLVVAGHVLATEGVIDSFGHVSIRHPEDAGHFFMPRVRAAELVQRDDILEFDIEARPARPTQARIFAERMIHAAIYRRRPDVMSVCHHHAPAMMPFCVAEVALVPVFHLGATMGPSVPVWDSQDEFGDTDLLVATDAQGLSLARALGPHWTVLMRGHGVTVAGRSLRETVFRAIYGMRNAETLLRAQSLGPVRALTPGEAAAAEAFNLQPFATDRAWEQWCRRAAQAAMPAPRQGDERCTQPAA